MASSVDPDYANYGDFALTNAISHLLCDVRETKRLPISRQRLSAAMLELNQRAEAALQATSKDGQ